MKEDFKLKRCTDCPEHSGVIANLSSLTKSTENTEKAIEKMNDRFLNLLISVIILIVTVACGSGTAVYISMDNRIQKNSSSNIEQNKELVIWQSERIK